MFFVRAVFMFIVYVYAIERISTIFLSDIATKSFGDGAGALFFLFIVGWTIVCGFLLRCRSHEMIEHENNLHRRHF
jgi:hypothetical protein